MDTRANDADALDSAGKILTNYRNGEIIGSSTIDTRQSTIVIASALLAIAVEVRRLTNTIGGLTDGQELAESVRIWGGEA